MIIEKAKELLSKNIFDKVLSHCEVTEFNTEDALKDIVKFGLEKYGNNLGNDAYGVIMGDNKILKDFVLSKMSKSFDEIAVEFGYTEYAKEEDKKSSRKNRK